MVFLNFLEENDPLPCIRVFESTLEAKHTDGLEAEPAVASAVSESAFHADRLRTSLSVDSWFCASL